MQTLKVLRSTGSEVHSAPEVQFDSVLPGSLCLVLRFEDVLNLPAETKHCKLVVQETALGAREACVRPASSGLSLHAARALPPPPPSPRSRPPRPHTFLALHLALATLKAFSLI